MNWAKNRKRQRIYQKREKDAYPTGMRPFLYIWGLFKKPRFRMCKTSMDAVKQSLNIGSNKSLLAFF